MIIYNFFYKDFLTNTNVDIILATGSSDSLSVKHNWKTTKTVKFLTSNPTCHSTCATCWGTAINECTTCKTG